MGTRYSRRFDHATAARQALAANDAIQAEARSVYGDDLTNQQCLDRVIAARWPNLPEREAYEAAAERYEVELPTGLPTITPPLTPTEQSEADMAQERG